MSDSGGPVSALGEISLSLLQGRFICKHTAPAAFLFLSDETNFMAVHQYLSRMGIGLRRSADGEVVYAAYLDADSQERRTAISQQFRETINYIEPLVGWLGLVMACQHSTTTISPGDVIKEGALLSSIECAPALVDELSRLSSMSYFKVRTPSTKAQLSKMLEVLCEHGYLAAEQAKGSVYVATGKWSYFYEVMAFIAEHEHIDVAPEATPQQELLQ
jgi:hypothetical protein